MGGQEILALALVALIVGLALRRRWRRRGTGACDGCQPSTSANPPAAREQTLHFHPRRRPDRH